MVVFLERKGSVCGYIIGMKEDFVRKIFVSLDFWLEVVGLIYVLSNCFF